MQTLKTSQIKLIAEFFSNMAIVWFGAAFISPRNLVTFIPALTNGIVSIAIGVFLLREVSE